MNLVLQSVSHFYAKDQASLKVLASVSFKFNSGKIYAIVGPSGCGKSTLLNIIAKVFEPSEGKVYSTLNEADATYKVGYVFQDPALVPWLSVKKNMLLGARISRVDLGEAARKVEELLISYKLVEFSNSLPATLSGGMQQRVSLIRAIVAKADVLLLDEPFSNIDSALKMELQEELVRLVVSQNLICILVTHDLLEAIRVADEIVVLSDRPASIAQVFPIELKREARRGNTQYEKASLYDLLDKVNVLVHNRKVF